MGGLFSSDAKLVKQINRRFEKRELARLKLEFKEYSVKKKGKAMDRHGLLRSFGLERYATSALGERLYYMFALPKSGKKPKRTLKFADWVKGICITSRGTPLEKWHFVFSLFDTDYDRKLNKKELRTFVRIFCMMSIEEPQNSTAWEALQLGHVNPVKLEDNVDLREGMADIINSAIASIPPDNPDKESIDFATFVTWMRRMARKATLPIEFDEKPPDAHQQPQAAAAAGGGGGAQQGAGAGAGAAAGAGAGAGVGSGGNDSGAGVGGGAPQPDGGSGSGSGSGAQPTGAGGRSGSGDGRPTPSTEGTVATPETGTATTSTGEGPRASSATPPASDSGASSPTPSPTPLPATTTQKNDSTGAADAPPLSDDEADAAKARAAASDSEERRQGTGQSAPSRRPPQGPRGMMVDDEDLDVEEFDA